ncbi:N-formylglutamate amidohydrolase [Geothermobacter ehrlichii]|uniref:N-formylglutamate amidohydrolase n=1 Tax=Geothermobacter ehrlichii TaxID=213224 RepID=A0A5D3WGI6_9BACT|nr:N-formylglutamate amidohydrolase [Geothermobacter ehrlichii]TYO95847.1 N-formylglutamate amidohydrolase [Geothermobacter ehrlichii]
MSEAKQTDRLLQQIRQGQTFSDTDYRGIARIRVRRDLPLVCVALHDGSAFPSDLEPLCRLSPAERLFEEDPHTAGLLEGMPVLLAGRESRYFYDLNRSPAKAVDPVAFGRKIWRQGAHPDPARAQARHRAFYRLAEVLIDRLVRRHGHCLVIDLHAYNASKIDRPTPLFNLGTAAIDERRHRPLLDFLLRRLQQIDLPGTTTRVAENDVFQGRGHFVNWLGRRFPDVLPLCLEVKKIYCDEHSGVLNRNVYDALAVQLPAALHDLYRRYRQQHRKRPGDNGP